MIENTFANSLIKGELYIMFELKNSNAHKVKLTEKPQWLTRGKNYTFMASAPFEIKQLKSVSMKYVSVNNFWVSRSVVIDEVIVDPIYMQEEWKRNMEGSTFTKIPSIPFKKGIWYRLELKFIGIRC